MHLDGNIEWFSSTTTDYNKYVSVEELVAEVLVKSASFAAVSPDHIFRFATFVSCDQNSLVLVKGKLTREEAFIKAKLQAVGSIINANGPSVPRVRASTTLGLCNALQKIHLSLWCAT